MAEIALGWLGWDEEKSMRADVNAIKIAQNGRMKMLQMIFGYPDEEESKVKMTTDLFDAMFGA